MRTRTALAPLIVLALAATAVRESGLADFAGGHDVELTPGTTFVREPDAGFLEPDRPWSVLLRRDGEERRVLLASGGVSGEPGTVAAEVAVERLSGPYWLPFRKRARCDWSATLSRDGRRGPQLAGDFGLDVRGVCSVRRLREIVGRRVDGAVLSALEGLLAGS